MKYSNITLQLLFLLIVFFTGSCTISVTENKTDKVFLEGTEYLGCFIDNPVDGLKSISGYADTSLHDIDTVYYIIENDTLILNIRKRYNCCGSLMDSVSIDIGKVDIFISDTCTNMCQCWCTCNFDFRYSFTDIWQKSTHFYIYLKQLNETSYTLWRETELIDGLD